MTIENQDDREKTDMNIEQKIAEELGVKESQVRAAVELIDEGCTIPFIARYRKEKTGSLNDEQLRTLGSRLTYLRNLEEKREQILAVIEEQGKLTAELKSEILAAETAVTLEDLYRPFRPKRRTRAMIAAEKGLTGLAEALSARNVNQAPEMLAMRYIDAEKGVGSAEEALAGASDILAEQISDNAAYRTWIRERTEKQGYLVSQAKKPEEKSVYEMYYDFRDPVKNVPGYRVLAVNRGEKEKILSVKIEAPEEDILRYLERKVIRCSRQDVQTFLKSVVADSYKRLIAPAIEREVRGSLTERAEDGAISVFGKNLKQLLMQPPIANRVVLGWDPAFRTGCKLAVVDEIGNVLDTAVIFPTAPTNPTKLANAKKVLRSFISKYHVSLISCGNGTASRESEQFIAELIKEVPEQVSYIITNEAGASVYSASALATEEFPTFDVGQRSAVSIARRAQDPLAELVKIDPKSIGVGQYQHDVDEKKLKETLGGVVESCVNEVGVDLNTASAVLLGHISGITKTMAKNIVAWREENGRFKNRKQLMKVKGLGPKAFEQSAGFLRISGGQNPLDNTAVHPESYDLAEAILTQCSVEKEALDISNPVIHLADSAALEKRFGVGAVTVQEVVRELNAASRDPRMDAPAPILRQDVLTMEDLKEGMVLKGTVRNIVDFGAFVDIGVHEDGLVHISKLTNKKFVKHPLEVVSVGDIVEVKVLSVDLNKKRIGLSMIL